MRQLHEYGLYTYITANKIQPLFKTSIDIKKSITDINNSNNRRVNLPQIWLARLDQARVGPSVMDSRTGYSCGMKSFMLHLHHHNHSVSPTRTFSYTSTLHSAPETWPAAELNWEYHLSKWCTPRGRRTWRRPPTTMRALISPTFVSPPPNHHKFATNILIQYL